MHIEYTNITKLYNFNLQFLLILITQIELLAIIFPSRNVYILLSCIMARLSETVLSNMLEDSMFGLHISGLYISLFKVALDINSLINTCVKLNPL
jgi:hypothetical protein